MHTIFFASTFLLNVFASAATWQSRSAQQSSHFDPADFVVNGTAVPEVDFDIGESYAGLLPITSNPNDTQKLFFWYFPSENPAASNEITIWLNGGPGASSLEGFLQENGPFLWQYGTWKPVQVSNTRPRGNCTVLTWRTESMVVDQSDQHGLDR